MKWIKASERLPDNLVTYQHIRITEDNLQFKGIGAVRSFSGGPMWYDLISDKPYFFDKVEWLDESQPTHPSSIEVERGEKRNDWNKIKIVFTDCWEFDEHIPEEARWMAAIDNVAGDVAPTKEKAFEEIMTSLKVLIAHNSGYALSSPSIGEPVEEGKDAIVEFIRQNFDLNGGDFYHLEDKDGDKPLNTNEVIEIYKKQQ